MYEAIGEARKSAALTISLTSPRRPSGICLLKLRLRHAALNHHRLNQLVRHVHRIGFVLSLRVRNVIHHALRVVCAESLDHLRADTARAASDQHNLASEIERVSHLTI